MELDEKGLEICRLNADVNSIRKFLIDNEEKVKVIDDNLFLFTQSNETLLKANEELTKDKTKKSELVQTLQEENKRINKELNECKFKIEYLQRENLDITHVRKLSNMSFISTQPINVEYKSLAKTNESTIMVSVNHDHLYDHDMEEVT